LQKNKIPIALPISPVYLYIEKKSKNFQQCQQHGKPLILHVILLFTLHNCNFFFDTNKGTPLLQEVKIHKPSRKRPGLKSAKLVKDKQHKNTRGAGAVHHGGSELRGVEHESERAQEGFLLTITVTWLQF